MAILFYVICTAWCQWDFLMLSSMNYFLPGFLIIFFAVVVIKCFMIGVNVWWVYLAPQNIPHAIIVLTFGNKVVCTHTHSHSSTHPYTYQNITITTHINAPHIHKNIHTYIHTLTHNTQAHTNTPMHTEACAVPHPPYMNTHPPPPPTHTHTCPLSHKPWEDTLQHRIMNTHTQTHTLTPHTNRTHTHAPMLSQTTRRHAPTAKHEHTHTHTHTHTLNQHTHTGPFFHKPCTEWHN